MEKPSSSDFEENFETLLNWLDSDRGRAGEKYEIIRRQLIKMFAWRQAQNPEDLADETINIVTRRVSEIRQTYLGDPSLYFFGVAKRVLLEAQKRSSTIHPLKEMEDISVRVGQDEDRDHLYDCLDKCILKLSPDRRDLLFAYYEASGQGRIADTRRALASKLDLHPAALRMAVHRTRSILEACIEKCMKSQSGGRTDATFAENI